MAATFGQACVEVSLGRYSKSDPYVGSVLDPAEEIRCDFPNLGIASDVGPDNSNHPHRSPVGTGNVHILNSTSCSGPPCTLLQPVFRHTMHVRLDGLWSWSCFCVPHFCGGVPFITQVRPAYYDSVFVVMFPMKCCHKNQKSIPRMDLKYWEYSKIRHLQ